jgi:hypothetical protein
MNGKIEAQKEAGAAFLKENREKPGVTELPEGIQYEVIKEGNGKTTGAAGYREGPLPWRIARWQRVRQLLPPQSAVQRTADRPDQRMADRYSPDERRQPLAFVDPVSPRLRRQGRRQRYSRRRYTLV